MKDYLCIGEDLKAQGKRLLSWKENMLLLNDAENCNAATNTYGLSAYTDKGEFPQGSYFEDDNPYYCNIWWGYPWNPFIYRGENKLFPGFTPSLKRPKYTLELLEKCHYTDILRKYVFLDIFKQTPYYLVGKKLRILGYRIRFDDNAIAQHYEFPSNYIDVTRSENVAKFFAYTYCENGEYRPIEDFSNYEPILYRADIRKIARLDSNLIKKITFQALKRPMAQSAMALDASKIDYLKDLFEPIPLLKDVNESRRIFDYYNGGKSLALVFDSKQYDPIGSIARAVQDCKTFDNKYISQFCRKYKKNRAEVYKDLTSKGFTIRNYDFIKDKYGQDEWDKRYRLMLMKDVKGEMITLLEGFAYRCTSEPRFIK